jgi:hypothetical protein
MWLLYYSLESSTTSRIFALSVGVTVSPLTVTRVLFNQLTVLVKYTSLVLELSNVALLHFSY